MVQPPPQPPTSHSPWANMSPARMALFKRVAWFIMITYIAFWYFPAFLSYYFGGGMGRSREGGAGAEEARLDLSGSVKILDRMAFGGLIQQAKNNGTSVTSFAKPSESSQRDIIAYYGQGVYMQPRKSDSQYSSVVLGGQMLYIIFDSDGEVSRCHLIGQGARDAGIDIAPGKYFTATPASSAAVEFVISGPRNPVGLIDMFLPGSPSPDAGQASIQEYMMKLKQKCQ